MTEATTKTRNTDEEDKRSGDLAPGTMVGEHEIERLVSSGGHGSIYRAIHKKTGARVAIKVLHPWLMALGRMAERFVQEVQVILRLRHPNIVDVHELGSLEDGTLYYVMEFLEGTTLRSFLAARGRLGAEESLAILEPVCSALAAAHAAGIVHRDVKASNIMISSGEPRRVKLLDFGIAKLVEAEPSKRGLTTAGQQLGTPSIMAPEQILCGPIDARTDIYALGALLHTLLTGRQPFESNVPGDLVEQHLAAPPPRPSYRVPIGPALDAVVLRALEKRPERRFESVEAFLEALREATREAMLGPTNEVMERRAAGVLVDIRVLDEADEPDDELIARLGTTLERAEECLRSGGFLLTTMTSTQLLGVRLLSDDAAHELIERRSVLEFGLTLYAALQKDLDHRLYASVAAHASAVNVRRGADLEIASGPLARTEEWAPPEEVDGLLATKEATEGLSGFSLGSGPRETWLVRRAGQPRPSMRSHTVVSGGVKQGA